MARLIVAGVAASMVSMAAGAASAQEAACTPYLQQGCLCVAPLPATVLGRITNASGGVTIVGAANFTPANLPADIHLNDGILIGPDGKVVVTFGSACQNRLLPAPSNITVRQIQGTNCACLRAENSGPPPVLPLGLAVGGGAAAAIYLIEKGNGPMSP